MLSEVNLSCQKASGNKFVNSRCAAGNLEDHDKPRYWDPQHDEIN